MSDLFATPSTMPEPSRDTAADPGFWDQVTANARAAERNEDNFSLFELPPLPPREPAPESSPASEQAPAAAEASADTPRPTAVRPHFEVAEFYRDRPSRTASYRPRLVNADRRYLPDAIDRLFPALEQAANWSDLPEDARALLEDADVQPTAADDAAGLDAAAARVGRVHGWWDARLLVDRVERAALTDMIVALYRGRRELGAAGPRHQRYMDATVLAAADQMLSLDHELAEQVTTRVRETLAKAASTEASALTAEQLLARLETDPRFQCTPDGQFAGDRRALVRNLAFAASLQYAQEASTIQAAVTPTPAPVRTAARARSPR